MDPLPVITLILFILLHLSSAAKEAPLIIHSVLSILSMAHSKSLSSECPPFRHGLDVLSIPLSGFPLYNIFISGAFFALRPFKHYIQFLHDLAPSLVISLSFLLHCLVCFKHALVVNFLGLGQEY